MTGNVFDNNELDIFNSSTNNENIFLYKNRKFHFINKIIYVTLKFQFSVLLQKTIYNVNFCNRK